MEPLDQEAGGRPEWIFVVSSQLLLGKKRGTDQGEARSSGLDTWVGLVPSTDTLPDRAPEPDLALLFSQGPGAKGRRLPASEHHTL